MQKWNSNLRQQQRILDRELVSLSQSEQKTKTMLKSMAKKRPNDAGPARILARELVAANRQKQRLHQSKAMLSSIQMQMKEQFATYKLSGTMQRSTVILKSVNSLVRLPELATSMQQFSRELMQAGVIEEMVSDAYEDMGLEDDALEEEADEEINRVLGEVTGGILGTVGPLPSAPLPTEDIPEADVEEEEEGNGQDEEFLRSMKQKLEALKS